VGPPPFSVNVELGMVKVDLSGELNITTVPLLERLLDRLDAEETESTLIDGQARVRLRGRKESDDRADRAEGRPGGRCLSHLRARVPNPGGAEQAPHG
jgi:hypothetical protein